MKPQSVGVIGLGIIGAVWARHYAAAGRLPGVWNRTPQPDFPCWRASPSQVVQGADLIQIVVADPAAVRSVLAQILPALGPGKIVVQSSTIDPVASQELAAQVEASGARYLEAPFTGSKPAAEKRQTVFFLGGDAALVAEAEPLLALVSAHRLHIGTPAQACALKLAMNLNIAVQMEALAEALTFVRRAGLSDDMFFSALNRNVSHSGLATLKESKLRTGDFSPQFSVKHMHKDMRLAAGSAQAVGAFPALQATRQALAAAEKAGHGDEDFSILLRHVGQ